MTTTADLERALAAAGIAAPVRWDEVTGSTNATARELAERGPRNGRWWPPVTRPRDTAASAEPGGMCPDGP